MDRQKNEGASKTEATSLLAYIILNVFPFCKMLMRKIAIKMQAFPCYTK